MQVTFNEIDGSTRQVEVTRDDLAFSKICPEGYSACTEQGIYIYKDNDGVYYLIDSEGNILAYHPQIIRSYIKMCIMK